MRQHPRRACPHPSQQASHLPNLPVNRVLNRLDNQLDSQQLNRLVNQAEDQLPNRRVNPLHSRLRSPQQSPQCDLQLNLLDSPVQDHLLSQLDILAVNQQLLLQLSLPASQADNLHLNHPVGLPVCRQRSLQ